MSTPDAGGLPSRPDSPAPHGPSSTDPTPPRGARRGWLIGLAIVIVLVALVAIPALLMGGDDVERSDDAPDDVLADAKTALDDAENLKIAITSSGVPDSVGTALLGAEGTAVRPDGFTGVLTVRFAGGTVDADVVATGGETHADLPFVGWSEVDPADYNAPDPGTLLNPEEGVSNLIVAAQDVSADGDEAESCESGDNATGYPYTGTLSGDDVRGFIPSADGDEFDVRFVIGDENRPCKVDLTGEFFSGSDSTTYTVVFSDFDDPDAAEPELP